MSDASEKPFEPTPQRIARARREGDVARSSEVAANLAFAAAGAATAAVAPVIASNAREALARAAGGGVATASCAAAFGVALLPMAAAALAGTCAGALQSGGLRAVPVTLKLKRCNPVTGVKRLCSRETLGHALRAALAFGLAASAIAPFLVAGAWPAIAGAPWTSSAAAVLRACEGIAGAACAVGLLFAGAEFAASRRSWMRKLRMTFEERRREAKDQEGDPLARSRRRAIHRSFVRGALTRVKDASFVVVNPTHVAVALEYRPPAVAVPCVLVRAADDVALRVRDEARRLGIPIVENAPLARALFRDARAGDAIPHAHYVAVAEVVASLTRAGFFE